MLNKHERQGNIWGLEVRIKAELRDSLTLSKSLDEGQEYQYILIGKIDTVIRGDWYSDYCNLKLEGVYVPDIG